MVKRIICCILTLSVFLTMFVMPVFTQDDVKIGYIKITVENDGSTAFYSALLDGEEIYLKDEDISVITSADAGACADEHEIDSILYDGEYFPLAQMLYLLGAQWGVKDEALVVRSMPNTILDFAKQYLGTIVSNESNKSDLLINGESELGHNIRSSLAAIFKDFNIFDHFDWDSLISTNNIEIDKNGNIVRKDEADGIGAFDSKSYKKAILQLAVNDKDFLTEEDQKAIINIVEGSDFKQVKSSWDDMNTVMSIPENINDVEKLITQIYELQGKDVTKMFDVASELEILKDVPWNKYTELIDKYHITDVADFIEMCFNINSAYHDTKGWSDDFISQIKVLSDFDDNGYDTFVTDHIKECANDIIFENEHNIRALIGNACEEYLSFLGNFALDLTPLAVLTALPKTVVAGASIFEGTGNAIDSAALSYTVKHLIDTEQVAVTEMSRAYNKVIVRGEINEENIERLRNATMLSLRCNLRNRSFIYHLNTLSNKGPNWERSQQALDLRQTIREDYAMICELMETKAYDRLLLRNDTENIFNFSQVGDIDSFFEMSGDVRQKFGADLFKEGSKPEVDFDNLVTDAFSKIIPVVSARKDAGQCIYRIPQINLPYGDVEKINAEIYDEYYGMYTDYVKGNEAYSVFGDINYMWTYKGDVLSVVTFHPQMGDHQYIYKGHNVSIETGKQISDEDLLQMYDLTVQEYRMLLKDKLRTFYIDHAMDRSLHVQYNGEEAGKEYDANLTYTVSDENIDNSVLYIDVSGDLCVASQIWVMAGSGVWRININLTGTDDPWTYDPQISEGFSDTSEKTWRIAYIDAIIVDLKKQGETLEDNDYSGYRNKVDYTDCELLDIDGDDIPELFLTRPSLASGCCLMTYKDGKVTTHELRYCGLSYNSGGGVFVSSGGYDGCYFDTVYKLENGILTTLAEGVYSERRMNNEFDGYDYTWNGNVVSMNEYSKNIDGYVVMLNADETNAPIKCENMVNFLYSDEDWRTAFPKDKKDSTIVSISKGALVGDWLLDAEYTMNYNDCSMWDIYGSSFSDSGQLMSFTTDGNFKYYVSYNYGNGSFRLENDRIYVNLSDGYPILSGEIEILVSSDGVTRLVMKEWDFWIFWVKK